MIKQREARMISVKGMTVFLAWKLFICSTWKIFSVWQEITPEWRMTEQAIPKCLFVLCLRLEPFMNLEEGYYDRDDKNQ